MKKPPHYIAFRKLLADNYVPIRPGWFKENKIVIHGFTYFRNSVFEFHADGYVRFRWINKQDHLSVYLHSISFKITSLKQLLEKLVRFEVLTSTQLLNIIIRNPNA